MDSYTISLDVPADRIVSIEHPCIILDIDRGVEALGGERPLQQILQQQNDSNTAALATILRAGDPYARKLLSQQADVNHLLLRVVLPKRTGRKRKRGSNDPFEYHGDEPTERDLPQASEVLDKLSIASSETSMDILGSIHCNHRFRSLPDFQVLDQDNHVMQRIAKQLLNPTLAKIKALDIDMQDRSPPDTILGPPQFVHYTQQLYYGYAQAKGATISTDADGRVVSSNAMLPKRRVRAGLPSDATELPTGPPPALPPLDTAEQAMQDTVSSLNDLLASRPIVTRRAAMNLCNVQNIPLISTAMQYTGYLFRSGPWKDTLVRFGLDPRLSSDNRIYQTLSFQLTPKDKAFAAARRLPHGGNKWLRPTPSVASPDEAASHVFSGSELGNTRTWQLLDLTDPVLAKIIAEAPFQPTPDLVQTGYFYPATIALIRVVMRDKITALMASEPGDTWDAAYAKVAEAVRPEVDPGMWKSDWGELPEEQRNKAGELLQAIRSMLKVDAAGKTQAVAEEGPNDNDDDEEDGAIADLEALDRDASEEGEED